LNLNNSIIANLQTKSRYENRSGFFMIILIENWQYYRRAIKKLTFALNYYIITFEYSLKELL